MGQPLDKEKMIQILRDFYNEHGRTPVYKDFDKGTPNAKTYGKYFGSWDNALELAGLLDIKNPKRQPKVYSDKELLEKLKDYCIKYGKTQPRRHEANECPANSTYIDRFGSMENALRLIGMEHLWGDKDKHIKKWNKTELINILIIYYKENKIVPKANDFSNRIPDLSTFRRHFGDWNNVLEELKIHIPELTDDINDYLYKYTKEEMINRIKLFYEETGELPTYDTINNKDYMPSYAAYTRKFGSIKIALQEAGLYHLVENKKKYNKSYYSREKLLILLKDYINKNNKIPTCRDLDEDLNMPCIRTYEDRFGSYLVALDEIGYLEEHIKNYPTLKKWSDNDMIESIKKLYNEIGKTPTFEDIDICDYTPNASTYYNRFGNLSNVFDLSDIPYDNKRLVNKFGKYIKQYVTKDGNICLSKSEYIITNWLENNNIKFNKEIYYKDILKDDTSRRKFDWIIYHNNNIYYIEYFGLFKNKLYRQKALQKIEDCKSNDIDLIAIYPKDLKNKTLEEIFSFLN